MMKKVFSLLFLLSPLPVSAEETRQLDAHEHGVGTLGIAIDGPTVAMEFSAPGSDIVGFEYAATSEADIAAVDLALETLSDPLKLFVPPDDAECELVSADVALENGDEDNHEHEDHGHDSDAGEHGDESEDHAGEASHAEFHAIYMLTCENSSALTSLAFAYFETFPNAREVEVQLVSASGAKAFEIDRGTPILDLGG